MALQPGAVAATTAGDTAATKNESVTGGGGAAGVTGAETAAAPPAAAAAAAPTAASVTGAAATTEAAPEMHVSEEELKAELERMKKFLEEEDQLYEQDKQKPKENEVWPTDQCGLEDDGDGWVEWEGPQRIKETKLTLAEQAKFRGILDQIFSKETILGRKLVLEPEDVIEVMNKVVPYLESEPMLIEDVPFGVVIMGDLHGQLYDLDRVFKADAKDGKPGWECAKYVLLGDYVDRGRQSLEIVLALFCIKMLHPDRIFLLRGNHEYIEVNARYGFAMDIRERYQKHVAVTLYIKINAVFCYLSAAAIVGNSYFCAHAGISTYGFTRRQMRGIYKPYINCNDDQLIHDLCWSDPAIGLRGTAFNKGRKSSIYFGFDALCQALDTMGVMAIFRGHQMMSGGYDISWNTCITIYTATDYGNAGNKGAAAVVDENGKVSFRILLVSAKRREWEKMLVKAGKGVENDPNEVTTRNYDDVGPGHVERMNKR